MMLTIFLGGLLGLVLISVPIAFALILVSGAMMVADPHITFSSMELIRNFSRGVENFSLLAIPFFMLAGEIMNKGGMSKRIVNFCNALIGHITGGMGFVGVLASMLFAGVSGSAVADTTAIGSIIIPIMKKNDYDASKSAALIGAAGCIGPIIPPSIPMILYATIAEVSVVKVFMGGIIPGIMIGLGLMIVWYFFAKKHGYRSEKRATFGELVTATKESILALLLPVLIMVSILLGIATATEAAVLSVVYALAVSLFVYREMKLSDLPEIFAGAAKGTSTCLFIAGTATAASHVITLARVPDLLFKALTSISSNIYVILLLVNILLLMIGCVLDMIPALMLAVPMLLPIADMYGLNLIYFGVIISINLCIGMITPPVGDILYIACRFADCSLASIIKSILPFMLVMIGILLLVTYFPVFIMFIPNLM